MNRSRAPPPPDCSAAPGARRASRYIRAGQLTGGRLASCLLLEERRQRAERRPAHAHADLREHAQLVEAVEVLGFGAQVEKKGRAAQPGRKELAPELEATARVFVVVGAAERRVVAQRDHQ